MKFLDFIGGLLEARMSDMNKMNGQSFTAQKLGLKSSQGSGTLFGGGVKHLFGQGIGRGRMGPANIPTFR
jgi:hypothetical protein